MCACDNALLPLIPNYHSSYEEAGRYLETYKAYENKPPDSLMERVDSDFSSRVSETCFVFDHMVYGTTSFICSGC